AATSHRHLHPLHDALPISSSEYQGWELIAERLYSRTETSGAIRHDEDGDPEDGLLFYQVDPDATAGTSRVLIIDSDDRGAADFRSEEHTSELQSRENLVCH